MAQLPTVEDVARVANVSRQTVSNVLNSPEIVKEATRTRVLAAIGELGYRPHASARRLRTQKSSTIGIRLEPVRNGISGSVLDTFLHALTEQADRRGMRVLLFTADDAAAEYVKGLGYMQAPVVVTDDEHWSGFRPDKIEALSQRLTDTAE